MGMTFGYMRVKTLTDASERNCIGDIRAFNPSIMVGVPAVWEMIPKGIVAKINSGGTLKKGVFNGAYTLKKAGVPGLSQLVDSAVFSQVKSAPQVASCASRSLVVRHLGRRRRSSCLSRS